MKRILNSQLLRALTVVVGVTVSGILIWAQKDVRIVVSDASVHAKVSTEIVNMDPKNPDEFWRDWTRAMELVAKNHTIYNTDFRQVLKDLTSDRSAGYGVVLYSPKPWATDSLKSAAWQRYSYAGVGGYFDRYGASQRWSPEYFEAYGLIHSRPYLLWLKLLSSLGVGWGTVVLLLFLLPYVLILVLGAMIVGGQTATSPVMPLTGQVTVQTTHHGGSSPHQPASVDVAVSTTLSSWLVVMTMLVIVVIRDIRRVFRSISTMSSRAPPLKEAAMLRLLLLCLMLVAAPATALSGTHTAGLTVGEWTFGEGALASWTYESGGLLTSPSAMLDGSALDLFIRYDLVPGNWTVAPGGSIGSINGQDGIHPYVGPTLKVGWTGNRLEVVSVVGSYQRRSARLADIGLVDITWKFGRLKLGTAYQPIRTTGDWTHRGAVHGSWKFPAATVTLEARQSCNDSRFTSMHLDVSIPADKLISLLQ